MSPTHVIYKKCDEFIIPQSEGQNSNQNAPAHETLEPVAYAISEGSDEPANPSSLVRAFAARKYKIGIYTMHNKFSNFLCFASLCAHLCAISNYFNCNDENRISGK